MTMTKTTAEELARVLGHSLFLPFEDRLTVAQAILASPVIAKIEREAEMRVVEWLRKVEARRTVSDTSAGGRNYDIGRLTSYSHAAAAIEAGEHKEKAGG